MAVGSEFALPKEEREGQSKEAQDRKNPHSERVSPGIIQACMGEVIRLADQQIQEEKPNLLDEGHQGVSGTQP